MMLMPLSVRTVRLSATIHLLEKYDPKVRNNYEEGETTYKQVA